MILKTAGEVSMLYKIKKNTYFVIKNYQISSAQYLLGLRDAEQATTSRDLSLALGGTPDKKQVREPHSGMLPDPDFFGLDPEPQIFLFGILSDPEPDSNVFGFNADLDPHFYDPETDFYYLDSIYNFSNQDYF